MSLYDEPKIDCHNHVFDPARFPYADDAAYKPPPHEVGTAAHFLRVLDAYGVRSALVVGPTSGYGPDNRCLLDGIAASGGRFKGIAVVNVDASRADLERLKAAGVVGVRLDAIAHGVAHFAGAAALLETLATLGLFAQMQVERDQLAELAPLLERSGVRLLIDHCGRPAPEAGLGQPGFKALLGLARTGRATVKLSGPFRFSRGGAPYADTLPYVRAIIDAYTPDACVWGSDWPFLRMSERIDYGPVLKFVETWLPDAGARRKVLWDTPRRLFGFDR
ncbi:MAG: amidohydrolase family protein [Burkholderiales bacterium]